MHFLEKLYRKVHPFEVSDLMVSSNLIMWCGCGHTRVEPKGLFIIPLRSLMAGIVDKLMVCSLFSF